MLEVLRWLIDQGNPVAIIEQPRRSQKFGGPTRELAEQYF
jgi:hypothetical protein|tara:strand:+ start:538 stop:657 length:120 start_codon:yes stop_codon:yes gene_type:complete